MVARPRPPRRRPHRDLPRLPRRIRIRRPARLRRTRVRSWVCRRLHGRPFCHGRSSVQACARCRGVVRRRCRSGLRPGRAGRRHRGVPFRRLRRRHHLLRRRPLVPVRQRRMGLPPQRTCRARESPCRSARARAAPSHAAPDIRTQPDPSLRASAEHQGPEEERLTPASRSPLARVLLTTATASPTCPSSNPVIAPSPRQHPDHLLVPLSAASSIMAASRTAKPSSGSHRDMNSPSVRVIASGSGSFRIVKDSPEHAATAAWSRDKVTVPNSATLASRGAPAPGPLGAECRSSTHAPRATVKGVHFDVPFSSGDTESRPRPGRPCRDASVLAPRDRVSGFGRSSPRKRRMRHRGRRSSRAALRSRCG